LNLEKAAFLSDQFHEIAVNDISVQRYKQEYAENQKSIEAFRG